MPTVSFGNETLDALKCYFSTCDKNKYESHSSAPIHSSAQVLKCALNLRIRFYLENAKAILL